MPVGLPVVGEIRLPEAIERKRTGGIHRRAGRRRPRAIAAVVAPAIRRRGLGEGEGHLLWLTHQASRTPSPGSQTRYPPRHPSRACVVKLAPGSYTCAAAVVVPTGNAPAVSRCLPFWLIHPAADDAVAHHAFAVGRNQVAAVASSWKSPERGSGSARLPCCTTKKPLPLSRHVGLSRRWSKGCPG